MQPDAKELIAFLKAMEFATITKRVAAHFEVEDLDAIAAAPTVANVSPQQPKITLPKRHAPAGDDDASARPSITMPMSR